MEFLFNTVFRLKNTKQPVPFSVIPEPLKKDFLSFIQYRAVIKRNGQFMVQPNDFKEWLQKLNTQGIDYSIDLQSYERTSATTV
jgi:hypothetical protein